MNQRIASTGSSNIGGFVTSFIRKNKVDEAFPPVLRNFRKLPYGAFSFDFEAAKGAPYEVQASTNLKNWHQIATGTCTTEMTEFIDSEAHRYRYRFYRVLSGVLSSRNAVGYATVNAPPGFCLIANPFQTASEFISAVLPQVPENTALHKYSSSQHKMIETKFVNGRWSNPMEKFVVGEGGLFFNPTQETLPLQFCGEVPQGHLLNPIPAGFSIRSSLVPMVGRINSDLQFPLNDGDTIQVFDRDKQDYVTYPYPSQKWQTDAPVVTVGEAFWVQKSSPANWAMDFRIQ